VQLTSRVSFGFEDFRHIGSAPVGRDERAATAGIELEAVERALYTIANQLASTEGNTTVRALVHYASDLALSVAPEDHFLAQAGDADGFSFAHFFGFEDDVPLVGDHWRAPGEKDDGQL
jgi:hypothetical protein